MAADVNLALSGGQASGAAPETDRRAFWLALMVSFGGFVFGLDAALVSGTIRYVTQQFMLNPIQVGAVVSAPGFGVIFALLVTGHICDRIGRRRTLLLIGVLYLVSAVAAVLSQNFVQLTAARFLGGLAFASLSVSSMYVGEIAPPARRGLLVGVNQLNIVLGLFAAYLANYLIQGWADDGGLAQTLGLDRYTWQWMLGVQIPPSILWILLLLRIPESPRWLVLKGRIEDARAVMHRIMPASQVDAAIDDIESTMARERDGSGAGAGDQSTFRHFMMMFGPAVRRATLVGLIIAAVQPTTGINAIMFYAPYVFEQLGVGVDASFFQSVLIGIVSVIATGAALFVIDRVGRKAMLVFGLGVAALSLTACAIGFGAATYRIDRAALAELPPAIDRASMETVVDRDFASDVELKSALAAALGQPVVQAHEGELLQVATRMNVWLVLIGIMAFIAAYQFSIGPLMWVVLSEIFPTSVRGVAIPACALLTSSLNFLVQQFFPWQLVNWGAAVIFGSYALSVIIGLALLTWLLPETKGRSIEEIAEEMRGART